MDELGRAWRRRALAAGGAAVIAPVAMVGAALAVGFGSGGGVRIGTLSQAFHGPAAPAVERRAEDEGARARARARSGAGAGARQGRAPEKLLAALTPEPARRNARRPSGAGPVSAPPATSTPVGTPRSGGTAPAPPPASPTAGTAPAPAATATPEAQKPPPGPVGQVGDGVAQIVAPVPGAGPPAAGLVDSLTDTVDGAVP